MRKLAQLTLAIIISVIFWNEPPQPTQAEDINNYEAPAVVQETEQTAEQEPPKAQHPCDAHRQQLAQYDWDVEIMLNVMHAESRCNTNAVGDDYPIRGLHAPSCGLLQVRTLPGRPSCAALKDPATNIAWAYRIYQGQGMRAWSVCKTKVKCY